MLTSQIGFLKDELDPLKWMEKIVRDIETVAHKVAEFNRKMNNLADGLRQGTFDLYANIRHNVERTLLVVGSRQRDLIDCKPQWLQRSVQAILCDAAGIAQETFVGALKVVDRIVNLIVVHASHDGSAKPVSFTTHSSNHESWQSGARATSNSRDPPRTVFSGSPTPTSPGETDPRVYFGWY